MCWLLFWIVPLTFGGVELCLGLLAVWRFNLNSLTITYGHFLGWSTCKLSMLRKTYSSRLTIAIQDIFAFA